MASEALERSRKVRVASDLLCERVFRPLAHVVVLALLPLRVPPALVAGASGLCGLAAAVELARGQFIAAALLLQLKTVLDNADGQLARLSGRVTVFGRYLDSELDLFVDAALFAAVGRLTGHPFVAAAGFLALTFVLSVNFNAERLYRRERGRETEAMPEATGRADGLLRGVYTLLYEPQDRLVEWFVSRRLRNAGPQARLAYHDAATVSVLANCGMSTQLAVFGVCIVLGKPLVFAWIAVAEVGLVAALAVRGELQIRKIGQLQEEAL